MTSAEPKENSRDGFNLDTVQWPPLPSLIRYFDDFHEQYRSINDLKSSDYWHVRIDGQDEYIDFSWAVAGTNNALKHWVVDGLLTGRRCNAMKTYVGELRSWCLGTDTNIFDQLVKINPDQLPRFWASKVLPTLLGKSDSTAIKSFLRFLCRRRFAEWHPSYAQIISALPTPHRDLYKRIRSGECFIPVLDQRVFANRLDSASQLLRNKPNTNKLSINVIRDYCILSLCFQYGLRPGQIARISASDIRVFETGALHVAFPLTKQRKVSSKIVRRIKREWCDLFVAYRKHAPPTPAKFFGLTPREVTEIVRTMTRALCGNVYAPGDFRHTASQRLVDSGASAVSVAEFLGHSTLNAGSVYYDTSANQAELINRALSISPIYSTVHQVALTRTLSRQVLERTSEEKIISGMPHGIPITGIGKCSVGQPNCKFNPIFSCYNCRHFIAIDEQQIHRNALNDLRQVARSFYDADRLRNASPAFLQLQETLDAIQRTLNELSSVKARE
ncbi:site-specific integrase [Thalassospira sp. A3_1]|uniref:site-specific integrase n=1 Tax=Thalassospira sp. A3_1 TaxID=2821088 RepID=UPI001ADC2DE8|nr:site-specific integrase [Thalassospira sp. A3_1]MBO9508792.1 site-specific integrase [Thalassospira sp. A3_1]